MEVNRDRDLVLGLDEVKGLLVTILNRFTTTGDSMTASIQTGVDTAIGNLKSGLINSQNVQNDTLEDRVVSNMQNRYTILSEALTLIGEDAVQIKTDATTLLNLIGQTQTNDSINTKLDTIIAKLDQIIALL